MILLIGSGWYFAQQGKLADYVLNVITNVMFLIFTLTVLNQISEQQQLRAEIRDLLNKVELDRGENSLRAFMEIVSAIKRGKYPSTTLRNIYFVDAKLSEIHLEAYHLEGADLRRVNFEKASLIGIYLQNANLEQANLRDVNLTFGHLEGVNLSGADLCGVNLKSAILSDGLQKTVLKGAKFNSQTIFNGDTILPNGTHYRLDEIDEMRTYLEEELGMIWSP